MRFNSLFLWALTFFFLSFVGRDACAQEKNSPRTTPYSIGWYAFDPYQYIEEGRDGILHLTGLDPELTRAVIAEARGDVAYQPLEWHVHKQKLISGDIDMAAGVTKTPSLDPYVYYSKPYRQESTGYFTLKNATRTLSFHSSEEFIKKVLEKNLRLAVVEGFVHADPLINAFIQDPNNQNQIFLVKNEQESLRRLMSREVDGFLADRLSGATVVWRAGLLKQVSEKAIGQPAPIHIALSKKRFGSEDIQEINRALETLKKTGKMDALFSKYIQPLILLQTLNSDWFFIIEVIGTIAFAISGLILAYQDRASYFGAFIYAVLPSAGGGILRDLLLGREEIAFIQSPIYVGLVFLTTLLGIMFFHFLDRKPHVFTKKAQQAMEYTFFLSDSIGLASFCVLGVVVAMVMHATPLMIWGPFMAFLTGAGGGILRDIVRRSNHISSLHGSLYPEVAIFWGFVYSAYLTIDAHKINQDKIIEAMIFTLVMVVLTRIFLRAFKIDNLYIRARRLS